MKNTAAAVLNGGKTEKLPLRSRTRKMVTPSNTMLRKSAKIENERLDR